MILCMLQLLPDGVRSCLLAIIIYSSSCLCPAPKTLHTSEQDCTTAVLIVKHNRLLLRLFEHFLLHQLQTGVHGE